MIDSPLTYEAIADSLQRDRCMPPDNIDLILKRIAATKKPKDPVLEATIDHAAKARSYWTERLKQAEIKGFPNWEFTYQCYADSAVLRLQISGGRLIEVPVSSGRQGGKNAEPPARMCSYGFALGSYMYPECAIAIEMFGTFVDEFYYQQENGYSAAGLRILGSADATPFSSTITYPAAIQDRLNVVRETIGPNAQLAYARAFYAFDKLNDLPFTWPTELHALTQCRGKEEPERGDQHRNIQMFLVVKKKPVP